MKKRIIALLITLSTLLSLFPATTFANSGVKVAIDGKTIEFDVEPQIINGRTMVPMRKIFEELGATVEWDGETKTITGKKDDTTVILQIGKDSISVNGEDSALDTAPCIVNNTTLVPVRAIAESFGVGVIWYGDVKTVAIYNDGYTIETERIYNLKGHGTSVDKNFVKNYLDLGWAYDIEDIEKVTVYAPDGRSKEVYIGDVPDEVAVGWYIEPVTTMYAPDGRTQIVPTTQVEANKNVGWYTEPLVTMYALDGRTQVVPKSQVGANKNVGWYETQAELKLVTNFYPSSYNALRDFIITHGQKNSSFSGIGEQYIYTLPRIQYGITTMFSYTNEILDDGSKSDDISLYHIANDNDYTSSILIGLYNNKCPDMYYSFDTVFQGISDTEVLGIFLHPDKPFVELENTSPTYDIQKSSYKVINSAFFNDAATTEIYTKLSLSNFGIYYEK